MTIHNHGLLPEMSDDEFYTLMEQQADEAEDAACDAAAAEFVANAEKDLEDARYEAEDAAYGDF